MQFGFQSADDIPVAGWWRGTMFVVSRGPDGNTATSFLPDVNGNRDQTPHGRGKTSQA